MKKIIVILLIINIVIAIYNVNPKYHNVSDVLDAMKNAPTTTLDSIRDILQENRNPIQEHYPTLKTIPVIRQIIWLIDMVVNVLIDLITVGVLASKVIVMIIYGINYIYN